MSDDRRRRRRPDANATRRSSGNGSNGLVPWLVTIAAALAVVAGGWFLGQALAHAFGRTQTQTAQTQTAVQPSSSPSPQPQESAPVAAVTPQPSPSPPPENTPSPASSRAPTPAPTSSPAPTPTPVRTAAPVQTPTPVATRALPTPVPPEPSRRPRTPAPSAAPSTEPSIAPVQSDSAAKQTVRSYIAALERGDPQAAASYLGNGAPDEAFINSQTRIRSMTETPNSDGTSKVEVVMQTSQGEYFETFEVAPSPSGSRILDKTSIKP